MHRGLNPLPQQTSHRLTPLSRADPGDLISICPQPLVGPRGPLKPSGRSQVSDQLDKGQGLHCAWMMVITSVTGGAANHCHTGFLPHSLTVKAPSVTDTHSKLSPTDTNSPDTVIVCRSKSCRYTHAEPRTSIDLQLNLHTQVLSTGLSKCIVKHTSDVLTSCLFTLTQTHMFTCTYLETLPDSHRQPLALTLHPLLDTHSRDICGQI